MRERSLRSRELAVEVDHRLLDQVGGRALHRRVHGLPLGLGAHLEVLRRGGRAAAAAGPRSVRTVPVSRACAIVSSMNAAHRRVAREVGVDEAPGPPSARSRGPWRGVKAVFP